MALYVGETVRIRTTVTDPTTNEGVVPTSMQISIWPPDPEAGPLVDGVAMTQVGTTNVYEYIWNTNSVTDPGRYLYKTVASGAQYSHWEYGTVTLSANKR